MNLIEAIKSGKPFRRPYESYWYETRGTHSQIFRVGSTNPAFSYAPRVDDVLADDWEVQEKVVTITRAQLEKACCKSPNSIEGIARALGFPEEKGGGNGTETTQK